VCIFSVRCLPFSQLTSCWLVSRSLLPRSSCCLRATLSQFFICELDHRLAVCPCIHCLFNFTLFFASDFSNLSWPFWILPIFQYTSSSSQLCKIYMCSPGTGVSKSCSSKIKEESSKLNNSLWKWVRHTDFLGLLYMWKSSIKAPGMRRFASYCPKTHYHNARRKTQKYF